MRIRQHLHPEASEGSWCRASRKTEASLGVPGSASAGVRGGTSKEGVKEKRVSEPKRENQTGTRWGSRANGSDVKGKCPVCSNACKLAKERERTE